MNSRTPRAATILENDADAGFTLIELVISIVLLTMIIGAISAAFVSSISATSATKQRADVSSDAQLIAGFLTRDAQAAGGTDPKTGVKDPSLGVFAGAFATGCATSPPGTPVLGLKWTDQASGTTFESNYSYVASATGNYQPQELLRSICSTTSATPATSVLANNVVTTATATLAVPTAWCDGNRPPASPACPQQFPNTVSLGVSLNNATQALTPPFSFVLTASLRPQANSAPDTGPGATTSSLLLLGGGDCITASSSSFSLTIYGAGTLQACTLTDPKDTPTLFGTVYVSAPGTCTNIPAPCVVVNQPFIDPYQVLIDAGALTAPPVNCSSGPPALGADGNWQPGTYPQDPQAGGTVHAFDPGVYVFCNGLSRDVTANKQGGSIGGTLFYFSGGSYNCETPPVSTSCNSTVQITPPTSGQYAGLAVWQAKADSSTITFSKGFVNITGTLYAPSAVVNMKDGTIDINQLIAYSIDGTPGNPGVRIGPPLGVILSDPLPPGTQGQPYSGAQALAVDGTGVYSGWSISGVTGLTINSSGVISGTPAGSVPPGVHTVTVTVHDNDGEVATATASITIYSALTITGSLPSWTVNRSGYPANPLTANGGSGGYQWSWTNAPPGLSMATNGTIAGTPTQIGSYSSNVTVTDSIGDTTTQAFTVTISAPPTIVSVQLKNGGTAGKIDKGDSIVVTFSSQMKVASLCSTWSNDANNQTLSGNGNVTVTANNGAGTNHDTVSVTSTSCAFNFGSIDLGSAGWVGANDAFGGSGASASSITWTAATHVLTITLGAGTTSNAPGATAPVYAASPIIVDSVGGTISNTPFALATGIQF